MVCYLASIYCPSSTEHPGLPLAIRQSWGSLVLAICDQNSISLNYVFDLYKYILVNK